MKTKITLFLSTLLLTAFLVGGNALFNFSNVAKADDCKHENAECSVNESEKPCCPGLICVPYNSSSGNGKCESTTTSSTSTTTTTTTTPCNGECCEISSWTCESCLEGPGTEGDKCFVTKWEYCKKEYGCDFVTDVTDRCDVEDCGEWSCPTDCKDISPSPEVSPTPTDEPEPTPTDEPEATPTPTSAPSNGGTGGPGDGLSDGRSDGLSSCPECTQAGAGGQVLGASTGPTKAVLGLSTTSGENELIKLAQVFGSFVLSMFGLAFYKKNA